MNMPASVAQRRRPENYTRLLNVPLQHLQKRASTLTQVLDLKRPCLLAQPTTGGKVSNLRGLNNRAENSHQPTRVREKCDAPLQVGAAPAALRVDPRPSGQPVHALPPQHEGPDQAGRAHPRLRGLGKGELRPDDGQPGCLILRGATLTTSFGCDPTS